MLSENNYGIPCCHLSDVTLLHPTKERCCSTAAVFLWCSPGGEVCWKTHRENGETFGTRVLENKCNRELKRGIVFLKSIHKNRAVVCSSIVIAMRQDVHYFSVCTVLSVFTYKEKNVLPSP